MMSAITARPVAVTAASPVGKIVAQAHRGIQHGLATLGDFELVLLSDGAIRPDVVKLDMSLVRGVDTDLRRQSIVRSMKGLCDELDIAVIAVPAPHAQPVVEQVVAAGIKAILTFSPGTFEVPNDVKVIRSWPRRLGMMAGVDDSVDAGGDAAGGNCRHRHRRRRRTRPATGVPAAPAARP